MLVILVVLYLFSSVVFGVEIKDIDSHWAKEQIQNALVDGWVSGYEDETFKPDNPVTRAEFLKMLLENANDYLMVVGSTLYPDSYIHTAKMKGLVQDEDPSENLTRMGACKILAKYIDLTDVSKVPNRYQDVEDDEDVLKLINLGVIQGYEDNTFRGEAYVTRAEAVVMLQRALHAKQELSLCREYQLENSTHYTNYEGHEKIGSSFDKISYEIKNQNLYITDEGRYQEAKNEKIKSSIFDVSKACKVIQNMVNEVGYVGVSYYPSELLPNQLIIAYGQNEKRVSNLTNEITITYYQNAFYNLREKSRVDVFSEECYMKISVGKLWQELHEFQNGNYIDKNLLARLEKALEGEFGKKYAKEITNYIAEKIEETFEREDNYEIEVGQKQCGSYRVDYYKPQNANPEFYISK